MGQYQRGSIRKVGNAWEWRYRVRGKMKQESYPVAQFPNESALWQHLEPAISRLNNGDARPVLMAPTMGDLARRYKTEYLIKLSKSTQDTDTSTINVHILPRWENVKLANIRPGEVESWIETLKLSSSSRGRTRRTMKQMIDRAMVWEMLPLGINPMSLVKVRGSSKRAKKPTVITPAQANRLVNKLPQPYSLMVLVAVGLGLRVSETLALKWIDFDFKNRKVTIRRAYTHSAIKETKTESSEATLPVASNILSALKAHKRGSNSEWVFPSPVTGHPFSADTILSKIIKPIAAELELPKIGWHSLRHSYRAWLSSTDAKVVQMRDMMRHADVSTTMDYGDAIVEELRPFQDEVAGKLKAKRPAATR
jgi:integrase